METAIFLGIVGAHTDEKKQQVVLASDYQRFGEMNKETHTKREHQRVTDQSVAGRDVESAVS